MELDLLKTRFKSLKLEFILSKIRPTVQKSYFCSIPFADTNPSVKQFRTTNGGKYFSEDKTEFLRRNIENICFTDRNDTDSND